jgi:hypothetical protein
MKEEHQVHAHLRDREHDERNGNRGLPDQIGAGDKKRRRGQQDGKSETDEHLQRIRKNDSRRTEARAVGRHQGRDFRRPSGRPAQ